MTPSTDSTGSESRDPIRVAPQVGTKSSEPAPVQATGDLEQQRDTTSPGRPQPWSAKVDDQRLTKLAALRTRGIDPYPVRFTDKEDISAIRLANFGPDNDLTPPENVSAVCTAGRVVAIRDMGKAQFLQIQDQTGKIQLYAGNKTLSEEDYFVLTNLDLGDIIGIKGKPFRTKTNEPSIHANELKILSKNLAPLPVVKEKDGETFDGISDIEMRYRQRYIDLAVNADARASFALRSAILREIRDLLHGRGFMEVETPMMQAIASGASARPFKTHHNALDIDLHLRIAPELYLKRLIVGGYEKVFEMNRNFRNEGISTKHNPEFTMIEIYQAYADYNTMMQLTEDIFEHLAVKLIGSTELPYGEHTVSVKKPWKRVDYLESIKNATRLDFEKFLGESDPSTAEAKKMAAAIGLKAEGLHTFWEVVDLVFSEKVEPNLIQPTIVMHYPKAISPLAKSIPGNEHLVERFEPYITGREMGNAFSELNDPLEQERRFAEQASQKASGAEETMETDTDFVTALKVGMPPTGGLGIGVDRLVMLFANKSSIKDVILFPLLRPLRHDVAGSGIATEGEGGRPMRHDVAGLGIATEGEGGRPMRHDVAGSGTATDK